MDYQTKPISRKKLRLLSKVFRSLFGLGENSPIPVLQVLERVPNVFRGTIFLVLEDFELPCNIPARCYLVEKDNFSLLRSRIAFMKVYEGALKGVGWCRGVICHEICHVFLYKIGFTPIL